MSGHDYTRSYDKCQKEPGRCISIVSIHAWEIAVMLITHESAPVHHAPNNYRIVEAINQLWNRLRAKCVAPYEGECLGIDLWIDAIIDSIGKSRVLIRARRNYQLINLSEFLQLRSPIHLSQCEHFVRERNVGLKIETNIILLNAAKLFTCESNVYSLFDLCFLETAREKRGSTKARLREKDCFKLCLNDALIQFCRLVWRCKIDTMWNIKSRVLKLARKVDMHLRDHYIGFIVSSSIIFDRVLLLRNPRVLPSLLTITSYIINLIMSLIAFLILLRQYSQSFLPRNLYFPSNI